MDSAFETPLGVGSPLLTGTIDASVHEHGGASPTTIIRTDNSWAVNINWTFKGILSTMITGRWHVHVLLESIGEGPEYSLFDADADQELKPGGTGDYFCHFDVPAGRVAAGHEGSAYKMVVTLTYRNPMGQPRPVAAYYAGPVLQFYNPA